MKSRREKSFIVLSFAIIVLLGALTLIFSYLFIDLSTGFVSNHRTILKISLTIIIAVLTAMSIIFQLSDNKFVYRLTLVTLLSSTIILCFLYTLKISGFWDKINSIQDLRNYISQSGSAVWLIFIILQILQVVALPIPGVITIGTGVALFGPFMASIYSYIGVIVGSIIAFYIGRIFGYKTTKWLVGDGLDKTLKSVEGKDKAILTFMFLFPFFPDDVLCFVAGLSSMSPKYFIIMILFTRLLSAFLSAYTINGNIIPFNTWWGILIWVVVISLTAWLSYYVCKNGEKIEKRFSNLFKKDFK